MNCREFAMSLDALLEGTLGVDGHAACARHVASCASCRELVEPMGPTLLPIAAVPTPSIVASVLTKTSGRRPADGFGWAETWRRWMLRPRFAAEAAYVGVCVLTLALAGLNIRPVEAVDRVRSSTVVFHELGDEAGILFYRVTSLWEKERT
jgi:hypothetical protein